MSCLILYYFFIQISFICHLIRICNKNSARRATSKFDFLLFVKNLRKIIGNRGRWVRKDFFLQSFQNVLFNQTEEMKGKKKAKPRKKRFPISVQLVWSNPDLCCPNQNDLQKGERKSRKVTTFLNRSCYQLLLSW